MKNFDNNENNIKNTHDISHYSIIAADLGNYINQIINFIYENPMKSVVRGVSTCITFYGSIKLYQALSLKHDLEFQRSQRDFISIFIKAHRITNMIDEKDVRNAGFNDIIKSIEGKDVEVFQPRLLESKTAIAHSLSFICAGVAGMVGSVYIDDSDI